jgi:hypothetical protein
LTLFARTIARMGAKKSTSKPKRQQRERAEARTGKAQPFVSAPELVPTVLMSAQGRLKLTKEKLAVFLNALAEGFDVTAACKAVDMSREWMYQLRREDEEFGKLWAAAIEMGTSALEDLAIRRARSYSDVLLMFMLKARDPKFAGMPRGGTVRFPGSGGGEDGDRPVTFTFDFGSAVTPKEDET